MAVILSLIVIVFISVTLFEVYIYVQRSRRSKISRF